MLDARLIYAICINHQNDEFENFIADKLNELSEDYFNIECIEDSSTIKKFNFYTKRFIIEVEKEIFIEADIDDIRCTNGIWTSTIECKIITDDYTEYKRLPYYYGSINEKLIKEWFEKMIVDCKI